MSQTQSARRADEGFECADCGRRWYYTRHRCPDCGSENMATYTLDSGVVVARTDAHVTPSDVRSPNPLALARFDDVQLIAQLTEPVAVGTEVIFDGEYHLRDGDETPQPRLTPSEE